MYREEAASLFPFVATAAGAPLRAFGRFVPSDARSHVLSFTPVVQVVKTSQEYVFLARRKTMCQVARGGRCALLRTAGAWLEALQLSRPSLKIQSDN